MRLRRNCRRASCRRLDIMCARQSPIARSSTVAIAITALGRKSMIALRSQCASRPLRTLEGMVKGRLNLGAPGVSPLGSGDTARKEGGEGKERYRGPKRCPEKTWRVVLEFWRGDPINNARRWTCLPGRFPGRPIRFALFDAEFLRGSFDQGWGFRLAGWGRQRSCRTPAGASAPEARAGRG